MGKNPKRLADIKRLYINIFLGPISPYMLERLLNNNRAVPFLKVPYDAFVHHPIPNH